MCLNKAPTRAGKLSCTDNLCDLRPLFGELGLLCVLPILEMETSPTTPRLNFQALSARLTLQGGETAGKPVKATERMRLQSARRRRRRNRGEVANNMVRRLQGVGMGKVDKFELGN